MIISVDADSPLPVYEQIREQVARMAVAGTLAPGTRMPTIRQLANDLQLAKGTVAKAYALLETNRIVESRGHKGTFIMALDEDADPEAATQAISAAADAYVITARQLGADLDTALAALTQSWHQT